MNVQQTSLSFNPSFSQPTTTHTFLYCSENTYRDTPEGRLFEFTIYANSGSHSRQLISFTTQSLEKITCQNYINLCKDLNNIVKYKRVKDTHKEAIKKTIQEKVSAFIKVNKYQIAKHYRRLHFLTHQCLNYLYPEEIQAKDIDSPLINYLKTESREEYHSCSIDLFLNPLSLPLATLNCITPRQEIVQSILQDFSTLIEALQVLYKDLTSAQILFDSASIIEKFKEKIFQLKNLNGITGKNKTSIDDRPWFELVELICKVFIQDLVLHHEKHEPSCSINIMEIANCCARFFYTIFKVKYYLSYLGSSSHHRVAALRNQLQDASLIDKLKERRKLSPKSKANYLALAYLAKNLTDRQDLPEVVRQNLEYLSKPEIVTEVEKRFFRKEDLEKTLDHKLLARLIDFEKIFVSMNYDKAFLDMLKESLLLPSGPQKKRVKKNKSSDKDKEEADKYSKNFAAHAFKDLPEQSSFSSQQDRGIKAIQKSAQEKQDELDLNQFLTDFLEQEIANMNAESVQETKGDGFNPEQVQFTQQEDNGIITIDSDHEMEDAFDQEQVQSLQQGNVTIRIDSDHEMEDASDLTQFVEEKESKVSKETNLVTDFDTLTYDIYTLLPEKVQKAICDYCQNLSKFVLESMREARKKGNFYYKDGLCLAKAIPPSSVLPTTLQLSEKNQQTCQKYVFNFVGDEEYLILQKQFEKKLLEPIVAGQVEELLWHLKRKEIQHKGNCLEESLQQKEGFGVECSIPLFFIYEFNGMVRLLPFSAFFHEGNLTGFVKENQGDAEQILRDMEIAFEHVPVIGNQQGYQISTEELSKLQDALLKNSKAAKPPFLLFERKRPLQKKEKTKVGTKRKRSSSRVQPTTKKRRKETEMDVIGRNAPLSDPINSLTAEKKQTSVLTADAIPSLSFPDMAFWPRFSLLSAEHVSKKALKCQLSDSHYKLLSWNLTLLEQLQKENINTSSSLPIWLLKPYQQTALDKIASLYNIGLSPILCFDMGIGKTYTYAGEIARFIAEGRKGNILVTVPPATEEQTYGDLIDALTEAQYTAALSSLQHLDDFGLFGEIEKQERVQEITNFISRLRESISPSEDLTMIKRNNRRKKMIQELVSLIPENRKSNQLTKLILFDFVLISEEKSSSSDPKIPICYQNRDQFLRIMQLRPDNCIEKLSTKEGEENKKIILATYPNLEKVEKQELWGFIVFDEAQLTHTSGTICQKAAESLIRAARDKNKDLRVLLSTGTPFENNLLELFTLINIANPGLIPKTLMDEFSILLKRAKRSIRHPESEESKEIICQSFIQFHVLTSILNKLFIHKSKTDEDVIKNWKGAIPEKNNEQISVDFLDQIISKEAWEKLRQIRENFEACPENLDATLYEEYLALNHKDLETFNTTDPTFAQLLDRVKNHPEQELPHAPLISALFNSSPFKQALKVNEKSILFVHNKATVELLKAFLAKKFPNVDVDIFTGETSFKEREEIIERFQKQDKQRPQLLIISLKTGGVGLNFPQVKNAFFLTGSYNPAVQAQAEDRIIRVGNTGVRSIYHFHLGTVGEEHVKIIHWKKKKESRFLFSKHLPKSINDFDLSSLIKQLRQFIKMFVGEKAHQKFKQGDFPVKDLVKVLFEGASSYLEDHPEIFEERWRKVNPFTAIPKTMDSEKMEIDLPTTTTTTTTQEVRRKRKRDEEEGSSAGVSEKAKEQKRGFVPHVMPVDDYLMIPWKNSELTPASQLGEYLRENKETDEIKAFLRDFDKAQNPDLRRKIRRGFYTACPKGAVQNFYRELSELMPTLPTPSSSGIFYNQNTNLYEAKEFFQGNGAGEPLRIRKSKREGGYNYDLLIPKSWFS